MVLGILIATITAPGLLGSQEAIRQSQSKERREEHRARRCNLIATCVKSSQKSQDINGKRIVLRNGRLWIDTGTEDGEPLGHAYAGYYLPYPDSNYEGLVTTITDVAPIMNWVYVDRETHQVRYGVRVDAQPNLTGPFDCTRQDRRLTLDGWEGWCAVEEVPDLWALYFDLDDNGLALKVARGARVLEIELNRKEKRFQRETGARQQDQTTKRAVDTKEDAPVDQPLGPESLVQRPGVVTTGVQEADTEDDRSEAVQLPFRMPESIFDNPPPLLEGSIFQPPPPPGTPPPAYTSPERPLIPAPAAKATSDASPQHDQAVRRNSKPTSSGLETMPPEEKRTTPKLNRTSGTRALAQAQKFEALSTGKASKLDHKQTQRVFRTGSNASSASRYSNDGAEEKLAVRSIMSDVHQTSPNLAPPSLIEKEGALPPTKSSGIDTVLPKGSISNIIPSRPEEFSKRASPDAFADPAVFGTSTKPTISASQRRPSPATRVLTSRNSPIQPVRKSPPLRRQARAPPPDPRSTSASSTTSQSRSSVRGSLSATMTSGKANQSMRNRVGSGSSASGRSVGTGIGTISPGLRGRAATMREGRGKVGRKTTSALFREIDELVSLEGNGMENGTGMERNSARRDVEKKL